VFNEQEMQNRVLLLVLVTMPSTLAPQGYVAVELESSLDSSFFDIDRQSVIS